MSKSYRKPVYKDGGKEYKQAANRKVRSRNNQRVRQGLEPLDSKTLVNPYDVCDWKFMLDSDSTKEELTEAKRK